VTPISDDTPSSQAASGAALLDLIEETRFPNVRRSTTPTADGTPTYIVPAADLLEVVGYLRDEKDFKLFEDITAVDWLPKEPRFQVVYHFLSLSRRQPICLKVELPGQEPTLSSITSLYLGAEWYEREVFDLFGITFENHPDLRRIEMPDDWVGHPLRKDYPVTGPRRPDLPSNQFRPAGKSGPTKS
jgi:NADH-quinone oxidoreductase subunit C